MAMAAVPVQRQDWSASLFGCCGDCGICCYGCWCLCCLFGDNHSKAMGSGCVGPSCIYYLLASIGCQCFYAGPLRKEIRAQYSLQERPCNDCCVHWCCAPCAVCQEAREIKQRRNVPQAAYVTTTAAPMPQAGPMRY
ncbi:hypothetical protein WJX74_003909 [Apatococcus lobatus]|uniref:Uncharacterized protein n=1 Tax=Apatococcus lobatus TaxID=904363 RepID=A0AAW1SAN9_9CHLO